MKKLQLKFEGKEQLSKEQMKKISGGDSCGAYLICTNGQAMMGYFDCDSDEPDEVCDAYGYGEAANCHCG